MTTDDSDQAATFSAFADAVLDGGDVYQLTDGRYGVVIGEISTQALVEGPGADLNRPIDGWLHFVAFVEIDGELYIDEEFPFCVGEEVVMNEVVVNMARTPVASPAAGEETYVTCR